jgi:hypothetical protein
MGIACLIHSPSSNSVCLLSLGLLYPLHGISRGAWTCTLLSEVPTIASSQRTFLRRAIESTLGWSVSTLVCILATTRRDLHP